MKICSNSQKSKAAINTGLNLFKNPLTKPIKLIVSAGLTQVQILTQKNVTTMTWRAVQIQSAGLNAHILEYKSHCI